MTIACVDKRGRLLKRHVEITVMKIRYCVRKLFVLRSFRITDIVFDFQFVSAH